MECGPVDAKDRSAEPTAPVTFLFWNIHKKMILDTVVQLAHNEAVDVLILAESIISTAEMVAALSSSQARHYYYAGAGVSDHIQVYTRFPTRLCRPIWDEGGLSAYGLSPPVGQDIVFIAAHLSSKLHQTDDEQALACSRLREFIDRVEQEQGHHRTVLIGDLNMDPFESGLTGSEGLHAIMDRQIAGRNIRRVKGLNRHFFYNPMWSLLGDLSPGPPGTYYYPGSGIVELFWHTFDQVLLRPELIYSFRPETLRVIDKSQQLRLVTAKGRPDKNHGADHLPISLTLHL